MGKVLSEIGPKEADFIAAQKVFFVATAPLDGNHTVSVSPKCNGCVILDPHTVMYGDLTGSGSETAAHLLQQGNGRMTMMFCNLEQGPPKILRLSGKAEAILAKDAPRALLNKLPDQISQNIGFRAVYKLQVARISTSCGHSLPIMEFVKHRTILDEKTAQWGAKKLFEYQTKSNSFSIDGLPSLALLRKGAPEVVPIEEEGYIHGKVVENGGTGNDVAMQGNKVQLPKYHPPVSSTVNLSILNFVAVIVLVLAVGIAAGLSISKLPAGSV